MTDQDLDKWAAEFMGWELGDDSNTIEPIWVGWEVWRDKVTKENVLIDGNDMAIHTWHPSNDLNQCFMVVEKMREKGWDFTLQYRKGANSYAEFGDYPRWNSYYCARDTNICLAILKAAREAINESPDSHPNRK